MTDVSRTEGLRDVGEVAASTGGDVDLARIIGTIPVVLVFLADPDRAEAREVLRSLGERLADFGRDRVQILAVAPADQDRLEAVDASTEGNARVLSDPDRSLAGRFGADYRDDGAVTVLVDAAGRVAAVWVDQADGTLADALLSRLSELPR